MLRLYDTVSRQVAELQLREPGTVSMYVCGPTVYDAPHLGHGRAVLVYDILRRYLEWSGLRVQHVSNITDIDDKIIQRAAEEGRSAEEVALEYEKVWYDAVDRLGVKRPTSDPHATAYVDDMVELVTQLLSAGKAYETSDGVYLDVSTVPDYGLLALQPLETLRAGARVDVAEEKRGPYDFALWKKSMPPALSGRSGPEGEPSWPSPWGDGRPGWHTECVVMSLDLLGEGFDLHTGGLDLTFPHHENERAQSVALGRGFARHWMHHAFVELEGEKMSKSTGKFTTLTKLLETTDPRAYRLLVLRSHYRSPIEVSPETVEEAERALTRLKDFARRVAEVPAAPPEEAAIERFRANMDDNLNTPAVVADLFELVRRTNAAFDAGDAGAAAPLVGAVREITAAVGLKLAGEDDVVPADVADRVTRRDAARAAGDFAAADALRSELTELGWVVEDTAGGTRVHR